MMSVGKLLDTSRITIVRAAGDNNMLIVDNYLYYFEDRGQNTFRWLCAKRKEENCRARLVTTPVVGDDTRHVVVRLTAAHTHERCKKSEIERATRRGQEEDEDRVFEQQFRMLTSADEDVEEEYDENDDIIDEEEEEENEEAEAMVRKYIRKKEVKGDTFRAIPEFEHNKVYLLRTLHNRELVCVNGFLYRLEGKSKTSATFRWECIRSDCDCKTRIYTERSDEGRHSLKQLAGNQPIHDHEAYSPNKLSKLVEKHKISIVQNGNSASSKWQSHVSLIPHYAIAPGNDPLSARRKSAVKSSTLLENKKITMLPSAKGNRVLCVDKMIYHYDGRSPCKSRCYWACLYKHTKNYKCNARLVTEETNDGLRIRKMSGHHDHEDHTAEIKRRLGIVANERKEKRRRSIALAKSHKSNRKSNFTAFDCDSSTSCSSLLSDTPDLPERLEDMRQNYSTKEERLLEVDAPERVEFVDPIQTEFFDNEYNYIRNETEHEDDNTETALVSTRRRGQKRKLPSHNIPQDEYEMDITKVSQLRSAKGGILLCVDGYIYHMKSEQSHRNYWICIKNRDYSIKCKSFVTTNRVGDEIKVIHITNKHNHPVNENDIKRRLCNELTASGAIPKNTFKAGYYLNRTLDEVKAECAAILAKIGVKKEKSESKSRTMKLYAVSDGPPSLAVRMTLKALGIPFELINVDYVAAEHLTDSYAKMNPQKEIPVLEDDGFYLSESIAIMQYLCDKYAPDNEIYPKDPTDRALVNHRLCFNMGFYYASISMHAMAPIFFDYPRNEMTLKKVNNALDVFETYLKRTGTKYAAGNHITIADFALVSATLCLEGIGFDLSPYPLVKTWYETFKQECPSLWEIANGGMQEIAEFEKNPPDLSHMNHPFHPKRKF